MTPVVNANASALQAANTKTVSTPLKETDAKQPSQPFKVEQNTVTLSDEGKALLSALKQIDKEAVDAEHAKPTTVESFTHGALGLSHPGDEEAESDTSYSAGQYVKGALSVGAILLALV